MSETKLATKADLQEMYDRILPYMGGMPEVLANKFSKGDLYSTSERLIGQWTDGKPLYQICLHYDGATITTNTRIFENEISALNADYVLKVTARYYNANASNWESEFFVSSSDKIQTIVGNNYVYLMYAGNRAITVVDYVIQYTKTTDSAIAIGSDTDYSTEEKIVGTWVDGKPLYQCTYVITDSDFTSIGGGKRYSPPSTTGLNIVDEYFRVGVTINNAFYGYLSNAGDKLTGDSANPSNYWECMRLYDSYWIKAYGQYSLPTLKGHYTRCYTKTTA